MLRQLPVRRDPYRSAAVLRTGEADRRRCGTVAAGDDVAGLLVEDQEDAQDSGAAGSCRADAQADEDGSAGLRQADLSQHPGESLEGDDRCRAIPRAQGETGVGSGPGQRGILVRRRLQRPRRRAIFQSNRRSCGPFFCCWRTESCRPVSSQADAFHARPSYRLSDHPDVPGDGDSWKSPPPWRLPRGSCLRLNPHQRLQAVDFDSSDPNSPLSARPPLKIVDRQSQESQRCPFSSTHTDTQTKVPAHKASLDGT